MPVLRPILFSAPMVRAILAGQKTQTRRVCKDPLGPSLADDCPYGEEGDGLWVRETWLPFDADHIMEGKRFAYGADTIPGSDGDRCRKDFGYKWKPSIHMPRAASRITLEITGVRVERVQEISESDAKAEGVGLSNIMSSYQRDFGMLWQQINGKRPGCAWSDNPFVWVVEFKRVAA